MPASRPNPRRAKIHRSYSVAEASVLFRVHRNTVRNWIKRGLPVVVTTTGVLILGRDLQAFLAAQIAARRRPCGPGELYCLKCREARRPRWGQFAVVQVTSTSASIKAVCEACGTRMYRRARLENLEASGFCEPHARAAESHLADTPNPTLICDPKRT